MLGVHDFWLFLLARFLLNVTPARTSPTSLHEAPSAACGAVWPRRLE